MDSDDGHESHALSGQEEAELLKRIRTGRAADWWLRRCSPGCSNRPRLEAALSDRDDALARLLEARKSLLMTIARAFARAGGAPIEDLVQEGRLALWRAAELYEPGRGVPFAGYAGLWVRQAVSRALDRDASAIQIPVYRRKRLRQLQRARQELGRLGGREPAVEELAAYLGLTEEQLQDLLATPGPTLSLDGPAFGEGDRSLETGLADATAFDPAELAELADLRQRLESTLRSLDPDLETALRLRYGLAEGCSGCSLREAARQMGVSHEQVRKLERRGLHLLRDDPAVRALSPAS